MATTLLQIRNATYNYLNDVSTGALVYTTDLVDQEINNQEFEMASRKKLQFLRKTKLYKVGTYTTLSAALGTGDATATVGSTTNFEAAGNVYINRDFVAYTGTTSTTLTGVSGQQIEHPSASRVYPLYTMPTDYMRMPVVMTQSSGGSVFYEMDYKNEFEFEEDRMTRKFTVLNDGNTEYLMFAGVSSGDIVSLIYQAKPTALTAEATETDFPDEWAIKVTPKVVAYKLMLSLGDNLEGQALEMKALADQELFNMYKLYGYREEPYSKRVRSTYRSGITDSSIYKRLN